MEGQIDRLPYVTATGDGELLLNSFVKRFSTVEEREKLSEDRKKHLLKYGLKDYRMKIMKINTTIISEEGLKQFIEDAQDALKFRKELELEKLKKSK